jgi:hypothetical protein
MPGRQMLKSKGVFSHFVSSLSCKMCCTCTTDGQGIVRTCSPDGEQLAKGSKQPAGAVLCVCARSNKGRAQMTGTGRPSVLAGREGMQGHRNGPPMHGICKNSSGETPAKERMSPSSTEPPTTGVPVSELARRVPRCKLLFPAAT